MQVQSSTTSLILRDVDFDVIPSQNTNGCAVQVRERHAADAANEEGHAAANGTLSRIDPAEVGEGEVAVDPSGERIQLGDPQSLQNPLPRARLCSPER